MRQWVPVVRRSTPTAAVVLRLLGGAEPRDLRRAQVAGLLRVRAVLRDDEPMLPALRESLTRPADLPGDIAEYITLVRPRIDARLVAAIHGLIRWSQQSNRLESALRQVGEHDHTLRSWAKEARVPAPGAFLRFGRIMPLLLMVQQMPATSVAEALRTRAAIDPTAFGHQVHRLLGLWPKSITGTLGWEWIADRFLRRNAHTT